MTSSSSASLTHSTRLPKWLVLALLLAAAAGLADATYLTVEHYRGAVPTCGVTGGCEAVLTSRWAAVGPVPIALFGAVFYATIFLLAVALWDGSSRRVFAWLWRLVLVAFVITLGLVSVQAFVIGSWCLYCLFSAGVVTLLFAVALRGRWLLARSA